MILGNGQRVRDALLAARVSITNCWGAVSVSELIRLRQLLHVSKTGTEPLRQAATNRPPAGICRDVAR